MAAKKRGRPTKEEAERKRQAEERKRREERKKAFSTAILMFLGLLFVSLTLIEGEKAWKAAHDACFGIMGNLAYLIGPVLLMLGVTI